MTRWTHGVPGLFDDMPLLAREIAARGARPGIWMRPAALSFVDEADGGGPWAAKPPGAGLNGARLRSGPHPVREKPLDLTIPDNLEVIGEDVARLTGWGFELVKHDFSTFDLFARWGPDMGRAMTARGWSHADRSVTNAEILLRLYRVIREAAGNAVVIGCNMVGHLAAGLVDVQRTGDDTSGTALFVSVDPDARTPAIDADLRAAVRLALDGGTPDGIEPLDWLHTTASRRWRSGGEVIEYDWSEPPATVDYLTFSKRHFGNCP